MQTLPTLLPDKIQQRGEQQCDETGARRKKGKETGEIYIRFRQSRCAINVSSPLSRKGMLTVCVRLNTVLGVVSS